MINNFGERLLWDRLWKCDIKIWREVIIGIALGYVTYGTH